MSYLHSLLKSLRSDLLEVVTFALEVHICLDRSEFLISFFRAELSSGRRLIKEGARKQMWFQNRRFHMARLETRTKEFIRMCEYVSQNAHMRNESER